MPLIGGLVEGSPAERAGFQSGDLIVAADGQSLSLWRDWASYIRNHAGQTIEVTVDRDGLRVVLSVVPAIKEQGGETFGSVGMTVNVPEILGDRIRVFDRGPVDALGAAFQRTGYLIGFTFESMWKMLQGLISPSNLSGPITIAQTAAAFAESGFWSWLSFLALLSVSLGTLNLLPTPVLDGGHLLFCMVEVLTGQPFPERIRILSYQVGMIFVLSLMVFALYNDVTRL